MYAYPKINEAINSNRFDCASNTKQNTPMPTPPNLHTQIAISLNLCVTSMM